MRTKSQISACRFSLLLCLLSLGAAIACSRQDDSPRSHLLNIDTPDKGYLNYPVSILDRSVSEAFTFNPRVDPPARITYRLTRDGLIRVRVCWRADKSLVLRTLADWTQQGFGAHELNWDGRDGSGNILENRGCLITFEARDPEHHKHALEDCADPVIKVQSPPSVRDLSEIKVEIIRDTSFGRVSGWELRTYADYQLVSRTSRGTSAGRMALPPFSDLRSGDHLITVNLDDTYGHIGTSGINIRFSNPLAPLSKGQVVFYDRGCPKCHNLESTKRTRESAGLRWIGSRRPKDYIRGAIADPRSLNRTARMPKIRLQGEELEQVLRFLGTLQRPAATPRAGEEIYLEEGCGDCHEAGNDQGAMLGPDLRGAVTSRSAHYLREVILEPQKYYPLTSMPPTVLSDPELDNLVSFLRQWGASCPRPTGQ